MKLKKVRVGVVQATPALFDVEKTVEIIITWIEKPLRLDASYCYFPNHLFPVIREDLILTQ